MSCAELQAELVAYARHELDGPTTARVRAHLAACPACRQEAQAFAAVTATVAGLSEQIVRREAIEDVLGAWRAARLSPCPHEGEWIAAARGELDLAACAALEAHRLGCAACERLVAGNQALARVLARVAPPVRPHAIPRIVALAQSAAERPPVAQLAEPDLRERVESWRTLAVQGVRRYMRSATLAISLHAAALLVLFFIRFQQVAAGVEHRIMADLLHETQAPLDWRWLHDPSGATPPRPSGLGVDSGLAFASTAGIQDEGGDPFATPASGGGDAPEERPVATVDVRPRWQEGGVPWQRLPRPPAESPAVALISVARRVDPQARREALVRLLEDYATVAQAGDAVDRGLAWLARHQAADGSWLQPGGVEPDLEVAVTALALLPFLAEGHHASGGTGYAAVVGRGIAWLERSAASDGDLQATRGARGMFNHALAMLALAEHLALEARGPAPEARANLGGHVAVLRRALDFLERSQAIPARQEGAGWGPVAGWGYRPGAAVIDTSVTAWCAQALAAYDAAMAALGRTPSVRTRALAERLAAWLASASDATTGTVAYDSRRREGEHGIVGLMATGHLVDAVLGSPAPRALRRLRTQQLLAAPGSLDLAGLEPVDYVRAYLSATSLVAARTRDPGQARWFRSAVGDLTTLQIDQPASDDDGSWPDIGRFSAYGGRTSATALALLTLQAPYRLAP